MVGEALSRAAEGAGKHFPPGRLDERIRDTPSHVELAEGCLRQKGPDEPSEVSS